MVNTSSRVRSDVRITLHCCGAAVALGKIGSNSVLAKVAQRGKKEAGPSVKIRWMIHSPC